MSRDQSNGSRFEYQQLLGFCKSALCAMEVVPELRSDVAEILVEGDLLGHDTHGLALLPMFLDQLERKVMVGRGSYRIINARKATAAWDGERLPGPWLVCRAIDAASAMAKECGTGTVVIRRSQHIGCLAAYLDRATRDGMVILLASSDPSTASVAAHGGRQALFTPNPIAIGFPTRSDPVLIDISASLTTNGMTRRLHQRGELLAHSWLLDHEGHPTRDPGVLFAKPAGTILPLGGVEAGHKGYGLTLLVEMLTGGLAGFGRADPSEGPGATVFVQLVDPDALGGGDAFRRQMQWIADACRGSPTRPGVERVRLPGESGLRKRRTQLSEGVMLSDSIVQQLAPWAKKLGVAFPQAVL